MSTEAIAALLRVFLALVGLGVAMFFGVIVILFIEARRRRRRFLDGGR